jgi:hypothetical protein
MADVLSPTLTTWGQHSHIGVPSVQMRKVSVECDCDCIIWGSIGAVCDLEWIYGVQGMLLK